MQYMISTEILLYKHVKLNPKNILQFVAAIVGKKTREYGELVRCIDFFHFGYPQKPYDFSCKIKPSTFNVKVTQLVCVLNRRLISETGQSPRATRATAPHSC